MSDIVLFAGGEVGFEVARFLANRGGGLCGIVLHSGDQGGFNSKIAEVLAPTRVFIDEAGDESTWEALRELGPKLFILAWWPSILREHVLSIATTGVLNFHPSLLPIGRGKHPNFWALADDTPFGVTLHFADAGVDTGDIAFQSKVEAGWEDTGETLYIKSKEAIVDLFKTHFPQIMSGDIPREVQDQGQATFHRAAEIEAASQIELDQTYTARKLLNLLRARTFAGHPACHFKDGDELYEVRVQITKVSK